MKSLPLALACAFACGAAAVGQAEAVQAGPLAVQAPAIDYHLRVLPNGLKVYSLVDRSTTSVAVQVWYGVGAKNDPPGRSGMAHLCEHLMFKGSRDMPPEFIDRLTDDVGGQNDASTDDDDTEYDETTPANYLERLLWAEAERMASLDVAPADFAAERKVVEQELRQSVMADPYRALFEIEVPRASFTKALYRQSVIGRLDDLEAATPAELRAFHARYYRPDNASLVVVGDFDQGQLDRWVDKYFGAIARPAAAIPPDGDEEPVRTAHRVVDSYAPDAPLPALVLTYAAPPAASRDAAALNVLDAVLTHGKTSRLNIDLVARRAVANHVFSEVDLWQHAGLIEVGVTLEDGVSMARGEAALRAELARVRAGAVTEAEVRAAKTQLIASLLHDRETIDGVADAIGEASILEGDASHVNVDARALGVVTAQDVRRVAQTYLVDAQRVTIRYHAAASPGLAARGKTAPASAASAVATPASADAHDATAAAPEPTTAIPSAPPDAGPPIAPVVPTVRQRTLPNGLRVIVARTGRQPIATAVLSFRGGSALDPPGKAGLAYMTAVLASRGSDVHEEVARASRLAQLGDALATETDYDSTGFRLTGLAASLPDGLASLASVVQRPQIGQAELSGLRRQLIDGSKGPDVDDDAVSDTAVNQLVFGDGPYGHLANGSPRPSAQITAADVAREAAGLYRPDNAVLVVTGGVDPEAALAMAERAFGGWARTASAPQSPPGVGAPRPGRVVAIDVPGLEEATVTVAARSIARSAPSYYAVELANALLGGGESSRLSMEIRVRRGLTYDATSQLDEYRGVGLFTATVQTENANAAEVAGLVLEQLQRLADKPPSPDELAARKADLTGDYYRSAATSNGLADLLTEDSLYGVDAGELGRYAERIQAVSATEVQAAAARLADPNGLDVVVVGDAARFAGPLKARFPAATLIRADSLQSMLALAR